MLISILVMNLPVILIYFLMKFVGEGLSILLKIPRIDGTIDVIEQPKQFYEYPVKVSDLKFYFKSRATPQVQVGYDNAADIKNTDFDATRRIMVIVHGWNASVETSLLFPVVSSALLKVENWNLIFVDWCKLSCGDYITAVRSMNVVGNIITQYLVFLSSAVGLTVSNLNLAGHSLGAHAVGRVGQNFLGKVPCITALDPAGVFINFADTTTTLDPSDGIFVETIHTSAFLLGTLLPLGHADFYPNGGYLQPGCPFDYFGFGICSHGMSYTYYAESIVYNDFTGISCPDSVVFKGCNTNKTAKMGQNNLDTNAKGIYFVPVNSHAPYGKG